MQTCYHYQFQTGTKCNTIMRCGGIEIELLNLEQEIQRCGNELMLWKDQKDCSTLLQAAAFCTNISRQRGFETLLLNILKMFYDFDPSKLLEYLGAEQTRGYNCLHIAAREKNVTFLHALFKKNLPNESVSYT